MGSNLLESGYREPAGIRREIPVRAYRASFSGRFPSGFVMLDSLRDNGGEATVPTYRDDPVNVSVQ